MIKQALTHLKDVFGYDGFRPLQQEIIENLLNRRDTLVIMPTGYGKSICYQIPALIFEGLTVVISPLISLMKDQVEQLTEYGIGALALNSSISYEEYRINVARIMNDEIRLLYLAPETLLMPKTLAILSAKKVACITIDEAHCISEWGHDFRPEYRQIAGIRGKFPDAVCIALTATATPRVQEDIKESLRFERSNKFIASFNRENLFLKVVKKSNPVKQTIEFLKKFPNQSGIIYCLSRNQVDELSKILTDEGFSVKPYHAGLTDAERDQNQEGFIRDDIQIIVATIAFGMGINKPNVRFVLHYDLPKNIESYYQQIGRAGRDGLRSECLFLFSYADIQKIRYFINQKDEKERLLANMHLSAMVGFSESMECRRIPLLGYFGENYHLVKCDMCDNCIGSEVSLADITIQAQKFLSCVKRTGEIFGAGHIIDVLRGGRTEKIIRFGHDNLSTYAIGKEYSKREWSYLSRQFIQKGLILQDISVGSLNLTPRALEVMRGEKKVFGRMEELKDDDNKGEGKREDYDNILFERLRKKRKELADSVKVPPYVIFPDKTLIEIATFFPQSPEGFLKIHGVGGVKFEKYGSIFLKVISEYCKTNNINEVSKYTGKAERGISAGNKKLKYVVIGEAYNAGKAIQDIVTTFEMNQLTVINHLYRYITDGNPLRKSDEFMKISFLSPYERERVFNIFQTLGHERMKPVFEALHEKIGYDELYLNRLCYLMER